MERHLSTAISDAVLCYVSLHAAYRVLHQSITATIGFGIIGFAAFLGTLKFGLRNPPAELVTYHKYMSWLGSAVAVPYIASGLHKYEHSHFLSNVHLASGFALLLLQTMLSDKVKFLATEAISSCAIVSVLLISLLHNNKAGVIGAVCYVIAGLVVKTEGNWLGVPRVDLFHYVLVIANAALMQGFFRGPEPVYYTPPIRS